MLVHTSVRIFLSSKYIHTMYVVINDPINNKGALCIPVRDVIPVPWVTGTSNR